MVSENHLAKKQDSYRGPDLKLYVRDVRDTSCKKRSFVVRSWATVKDMKEAIQKITQVPVSAQRLYFGPLLSSGKELPNHRSLHDAGIYRSGETVLMDMKGTKVTNSNDICVSISISTSLMRATPRSLRQTIQNARRAFEFGLKPDLVMDGSGGSYYIHDARKNKIGVFKPADEEPYAENNPRGYVPQAGKGAANALREGIAPGEACIREVAAFLLDHNGFAGVPMTTLVEAQHPAFNTNGARLKLSEGGASMGAHSILPGSSSSKAHHVKKVGSFQEFVRAEGSMDDLSPSKLSVEQVHKIAILDIRLMNADRNAANLLCRRLPDNSLELVPIDHGYCLRSTCDVSWMDWCWIDWPQLKEPLSDRSKAYIQKLDPEADAKILQEGLNIPEVAIDYLRASTSLLKAGVEAGLSLYNIAVMCCRNDNLAEKPSLLEHLTTMAEELAQVALSSEQFHHTAASQALEEQLTPKRPNMVTSRDRSSSRNFHRCASSGEFLSITLSHDDDDDDDGFFVMDNEDRTELIKAMNVDDKTSSLSKALDEAAKSSPPLAQLSGSDASSENGNFEEKEEVEQWASDIIEDSFQYKFSLPTSTRGQRSESLSSEEGSLSTSPKGFWHIRPGSSVAATAALIDDCGSVNSFGTSPEEEPSFLMNSRRQSVSFADPPERLSVVASVNNPIETVASVDKLGKRECSDSLPPSTLPFSERLIMARQESNATMSSAGISRSKSFTALSRRSAEPSLSSMDSGLNSKTLTQSLAPFPAVAKRAGSFDDNQFFRTYFLKFLDLAIAREMARQSAGLST